MYEPIYEPAPDLKPEDLKFIIMPDLLTVLGPNQVEFTLSITPTDYILLTCGELYVYDNWCLTEEINFGGPSSRRISSKFIRRVNEVICQRI